MSQSHLNRKHFIGMFSNLYGRAGIFRPSAGDCHGPLRVCVGGQPNEKLAAGEQHVRPRQQRLRRSRLQNNLKCLQK
jgi:hypothetical protein